MKILEAGTKLEIIIKVLDAVVGWAIIDRKDGSYIAVEKGRESCKHKGTTHCKYCADPTNVPCGSWEVDEALLETPIPLSKCDLSGVHAACTQCRHAIPHIGLSTCPIGSTEEETCLVIGRNVKCVLVKEAYING